MKIVKNIIFAVITLFIFILVSELSLSIIFYSKHKKVSFLIKKIIGHFEAEANARKSASVYEIPWDFEKDKMRPGKYTTEEGIEYEINSRGFRGKEFDPINKLKYRIICFGGSSTIGLNSPEDSTYPAILERLLIITGIDAEVLNFGFCSKSLNYIEKLLSREAISYRPNLITIYSNRNTALYDSASSCYKTQDIVKGRFAYKLHNLHYALYENLMIYRAMFCMYRKLALPLHTTDIQIGERKINEVFFRNEYPKKLERIILAGELNGFKVCLIKQPLYLNPRLQMEIKDYPIDKLIQMMKEKDDKIYTSKSYPTDNNTTKFWILTSTILNKQLDNLKNNYKDVILVDPLEKFLGKGVIYEDLFHDYVHLTSLGNELLAETISASIKQAILNNLLIN